VSLIEEMGRMQRELNALSAAQTPEERAADAVVQLRYIASTEPEEWAWLFAPSQTP
jgi:hypothetical protein